MHSTFPSLENPLAAAPVPMLGAIDTFWIIVAIAIGTWVYETFRRKTASRESGPSSPEDQPSPPSAPPRAGGPPSTARSWEEELRRLLGEAPPTSAPPPPASRPSPPPVPPVVVTRPKPVSMPQPVVRSPTPPPAPVRPPQTVLAPPRVESEKEEPTMLLAKFKQSRAAYQRASQLHKSVAAHLRKIDQQTEQHLTKDSVPQRKSGSPDATAAVALIRHPRTVRQAVVVSLVFGPPKSLSGE